ncbi:hypothetical protein Moror_16235 [Moniliophthora roreri MCA 2997]|uniref:F-box domain-containing protein n=2 Tax=Moniliophthora roreri TaxID=221103 RepID=V2X6K5_MONRO|nr:hypothetical protein Moror_16235 [Moniliophthora roreri MCA 2997]
MDKLATELIQEVALQTDDHRDLKSLRLVNRTLNEAVEQVLWDTRPAVVHLNRDTLHDVMAMLHDLKDGCSASTRIRQLRIISLSPQKEFHPPRRYTTFADGEWKTVPPEPLDTPKVKEALERLPDILPGALCALKRLVSVQWTINEKDQFWTQDVVMESLASLPLLAQFEVDTSATNATPVLSFHKLRQGTLKRLSVKGCFSDFENLESALSTLLLHNPNLVELKLDKYSSPHSFQSLIEQLPVNTLRLESLHLRGWNVQPTLKMICHFRSLHTLCLLDDKAKNHHILWKSLQLAGISLRHLTVEPARSSELLAYLESFSGLEELSILYPDEERKDSDDLARRFYQDTLPRHSESLRKLEVLPHYEGVWAIGLDDVHVFGCCKRLVSLSVSLKADDVQPKNWDLDVVANLINRLTEIPSMEFIMLRPATPNSYRRARCGTGRVSFITRMTNEIVLAVEDVQSRTTSFLLSNRQFRVAVKNLGWGRNTEHCVYVLGGGSSEFSE